MGTCAVRCPVSGHFSSTLQQLSKSSEIWPRDNLFSPQNGDFFGQYCIQTLSSQFDSDSSDRTRFSFMSAHLKANKKKVVFNVLRQLTLASRLLVKQRLQLLFKT